MTKLALSKQKAAEADAQQGTGGLLTRKVDAAAKALLTNKVNPNQAWQVILVGDKSYSMNDEYDRGTVQDVVERALGFSVIVDDDGTVQSVFFGGNIAEYEIKLNKSHDFVRRNRIRPDGGTPMAQAVRKVAEITGNGDLFRGGRLFARGSTPSPSVQKMVTPAFVIVVTDGAPNRDERQPTVDAIQRLSYRGVFFKFLYVGNDSAGWDFLESLDNEIPVGVSYENGGRLIDNVSAINVGNIGAMSDEEFYAAMFKEVSTWLPTARQNGLI